MLARKEISWHPQQRSTPPAVTRREFNGVPEVPNHIQKPDTQIEFREFNISRARWRWPLFKRHQTFANPTPLVSRPNVNLRATSLPVSNQRDAAVIPPVLIIKPLQQIDIVSTDRVYRPLEGENLQDQSPRPEELQVQEPSSLPSEVGMIEAHEQGPSEEQSNTTDPVHADRIVRPRVENSLPSLPTVNTQELCANSQPSLHRLAPNCYRAIDVPVPKLLQLESNPDLQIRLRTFLQSLCLPVIAGILFDCICASTTSNPKDLKPTIIFLCLTAEQHKTISSALKQRAKRDIEVVPLLYY